MNNLFRLDTILRYQLRSLTTDSPGTGGGKRLPSLILGAVTAGAIVTAIVVAFFAFGGGDKLDYLISAATVHPNESTAEWVSDDAVGYASVNLRPGLSELLRARSFFENLIDFDAADEDFNDSIDELSETLGIDLREDVFPVLGPEIAVAAYGGEGIMALEEPDVIAFVGFLDMEVGRSLLDSAVAAAEDRGDSVETLEIDGETVYLVNGSIYAMAHSSEPYLLLSSTRGILDHTLSMMEEPVDPLSENPDFIAAMERLPEKRFASGYMDASALLTEEEAISIVPFAGVSAGDAISFAGALTIGDKDLRLDYVTRAGTEGYESIASIDDSLDRLPSDLVGFMAMGGLGTYIDTAFSLEEEQEAQNFLFDAFEDATGLDLQEDVLDPLGDEIAISLVSLEPGGEDGNPFSAGFPDANALALVEIDDIDRMKSTMETLRELAADSGIEFSAVDINGVEAWVADVPEDSGPTFAFMFLDDFLVGGLSVDSLELAQQVANGNIDNVRDNESYDRVIDILGDDSFMTFFVDSETLGETVRKFIPEDDLAEFDERYAPWFAKIDAFAMTTSFDGEWSRTTGILTLN